MKIKKAALGLLILTLVITASGCGAGSADKSSDTIKFAIVGPMTGDSATYGLQEKNGADIAVQEINAAGGIDGKKLEYIVGDDVGNPNQATILAQKNVTDDSLLFILGHPTSGSTLAALPTYQKAGLPMITPSATNPTLTKQGFDNFFRVITNDDIIVSQQVELAITELGGKKPALIWDNSDYGKGMHDAAVAKLKEMNVTPVGDESFVPGVDRDFSAQITKFKGAGADTVLFLGDYTGAALFAQQNISLGLNAQMVGPSSTLSPKLLEIGGKAVENFYTMSAFDPNNPSDKIQTFVKKYKEKYNEEPGEWSSHAYDIVYLVKAAYEAGGTTRESLMAKLHELKGFEGVTGKIEFDKDGEVSGKKVMMLVVKDGKFESYTPTKM